MIKFKIKDSVFEKGKNIETAQEFAELIEQVENNFFNNHISISIKNIGAVLACVANYFVRKTLITRSQEIEIMWNFIKRFAYPYNKCGMKLVDYDEMLYPQYEYKFCDKIIPKYTWEAIQKQAKENLEEHSYNASPRVIDHWQSIVNGKVPFGYAVEE